MARIKRAVNAHKSRRKVMKLAKGYWGAKSKQYRAAKEQVARSLPRPPICGMRFAQ